MKPQSKLLVVAILASLLIGMAQADPTMVDRSSPADEPHQRNIILMIGDGMGFNHTRLARLVEYGMSQNLSMESAPNYSSVITYSADNAITDSAAAATAMATGQKTNNGILSLAPNGTLLPTILEISEYYNKTTGLVATSEIQHATPAAFMTHVTSRSDYTEITRQIVEEAQVDILLGGGASYFTANQIEAMETRGYSIVQNRTSLLSLTSGKVLGLFSNSHMPYEQNRNLSLIPSLSEMTEKAIEILDDAANGFFLMVEGSKIDLAAHDHDIVNVALDAIAFDEAVKYAMNYVQNHPETILIVTADHETGGLSISGDTLSDELPESLEDELDRRTLRIERAQNISVSWSSTYHTNANVPLFLFVPDSIQVTIDAIDNTQIFDIMNEYLLDAEATITTLEPVSSTPTIPSTTTSTSTEPTYSTPVSNPQDTFILPLLAGVIICAVVISAIVVIRIRKPS